MKNLRLTLGIAAIAIGSFAAFSFTKIEKSESKALNTYYPVKDANGTGFTWQMIDRSEYDCKPGSAACAAYQGASAPAPNTLPPGYTADGHVLERIP